MAQGKIDAMTVTTEISNHNFFAFLWHAVFLAFAKNFMDVDTVIPAMLIESGGGAVHIGIMTAIMMGGSSFTQLFFAPYISNHDFKKNFLLAGINSRIISLFALGLVLYFLRYQSQLLLWSIFLLITIFSLGGAFANISYTDIVGKSINAEKRKVFFSARQIISGTIIIVSAFLAKKVLSIAQYPSNYAYMFFIGGTLLLTASGGFWRIKEYVPSTLTISGVKNYVATLRSELTRNRRLLYFLGFVNTQGIIISFLPFAMLYGKEMFDAQSSDTGYFLLHKIAGTILVSLLIFCGARRIKYNSLLYTNLVFSILLILGTLFVADKVALRYIFVAGGMAFSLYTITMEGLLLEVSSNDNRALYTGFAGAGNIFPAVFPLAGGWIINRFGFPAFFVLSALYASLSGYFIKRIDCKK
ncbi:MAG: MFS transporter [Thermodesulfobacteriota bacterium]